MALKNSLVQVAPKLLCWYGMPLLLNESQRFHLLLHDLYLHPVLGDAVESLPQLNGRTTAYVFSFDHYAPIMRAHSESLQVAAARKLADYINTFCSHNSIVVTRTLSPRVEEVFHQADLAFLQKDLTFEKPFFQFLREHAMPLFHRHERPDRNYLRVVPKEAGEYRVFIKNLGRPSDPTMTARLVNLSLNGVGLKMQDTAYRKLDLRDAVQVTLRSPKAAIHINCGFVTRINPETDEIAVNFSLHDKSFVESRDAVHLQRLVLQTLEHAARMQLSSKHNELLGVDLDRLVGQG
ncbi:MAG TPA: PilZ domain-containing protein [Turneriella sp.]|nr:PilZ domain-containing protein [Turneriella sp.]